MTKSEYIQQASLILLGSNANGYLSFNDLDDIVKNANELADKIFPQEKEEELDLLDKDNVKWIPKPGDIFVCGNDSESLFAILDKSFIKETGESYYIYRIMKTKLLGLITPSELKELKCRFIGKNIYESE